MALMQLQQNRYLWVHLVGLAAVPLLLDICLAGLASAGPAFDYPPAGSLQFWAIALIGIIPTLWMQLAKPFYIFSLPPLALRPNELTEDQRRCLQLLKTLQMKILAVMTAGFSGWLLWWLYERSPQIFPVVAPTTGLISAAVSFFLICAFLQIAVSAGRSILVGPNTLRRVMPVEGSAIAADFLILGLRVKKILPTEVYAEPAVNSSSSQPEPASQPIKPIEPLSAEPSSLTEGSEPFDFDSTKGDELASDELALKDTDVESSDADGAELEASALESGSQGETKPKDVDKE